MPVTLPPTPLATQADLDALAARVTDLELGRNRNQPSATGAYITHPTDPPVIDDATNQWSLVTSPDASLGLQIAVEPAMAPPPAVVDPVTRNVTKLGIDLVAGRRQIVQQNAAGNFYTAPAPGQSWQQIAGPDGPLPPPGSTYKVQGGRFYTPAGQPFRARGVNVAYRRLWGDNAVDIGRVNLAALRRAYPTGFNFVRFACHGENPLPPANDPTCAGWVRDLTGAGIVVLVDLHYTGGVIAANDGRANAWLADWAGTHKANPNVWFDTQNEPQGSGAAISAMMAGQYHAIRGAGNPNPVLLSGGNFGDGVDGMNPADFAGMTNAGWDAHCYGWMTPRWPDYLNSLSRYKSADGALPVICGEFGDGGGSNQRDANWVQNVQTATANPGGFAAWLVNWQADAADCLWSAPFDGSVIQADYGVMVRDAIAAA